MTSIVHLFIAKVSVHFLNVHYYIIGVIFISVHFLDVHVLLYTILGLSFPMQCICPYPKDVFFSL